EARCRRGGDGDRAACPVDRSGDGVGRGDRAVARLGEGDGVGEGVGSVVEGGVGVVCGERRAGAAAGEVDGAGVAGGGVVVRVRGGERTREGSACGPAGRRGYGEARCRRGGDGDRAARAVDRAGDGVGGGDGAVARLGEGDGVGEGVG